MSKKSDGTQQGTGSRSFQGGSAGRVSKIFHWDEVSAGFTKAGLERRWDELDDPNAAAPSLEAKEAEEGAEGSREAGSDMATVEFRLQQILSSGPLEDILLQLMSPSFWKDLGKARKPSKGLENVQSTLLCVAAMTAVVQGFGKDSTRWDNRIELRKAYNSLTVIDAAEEEEQVEVIRTHALVCLALERFLEGQKSAEKLEAMGESDEMVQGLYGSLPDLMKFPVFISNYVTRFNTLDDILQSDAFQAVKLLRKKSDAKLSGRTVQHMREAVLANTGLLAFLDEDLVRSAVQSGELAPIGIFSLYPELDLLPLEYVADGLGACLEDAWITILGMPPLIQQKLQACFGPETPGDAFRIRVSDSPNHQGADVLMYHKILKDLDQSEDPDGKVFAQFTMQLLASAVLGYLNQFLLVRSFTVSDTVLQKRSSHSLLELPQLLSGLGYANDVTIAGLENKITHTYRHTPAAPGADGPLRSDITTGWTRCWPLQDEYCKGKEDAFTHYLNMGIGASFVAWPKSIMNCSFKEFVAGIQKELSTTLAKDAYRIIGGAVGTEYCYLDLLLWATPPVITGLETFFRRLPHGDQARFQPFCRRLPPVPISLDGVSVDYGDEQPPESTDFTPSTTQSKGKSGTGKKKSSGKGKGKRK